MIRRAADPLSDVLAVLGLRGVFRLRCELESPFAIAFDAVPNEIAIHLCIEGSCTLSLEHGSPVRLVANELAVVPRRSHVLADGDRAAGMAATPRNAAEVCAASAHDVYRSGSRIDAVILTGICRFDPGARHPLLERLPEVLVVAADAVATFGWMRDTVDLLNLETLNRSPGALTIASESFGILFVQALRAHAIQCDELGGQRAGRAGQQGFLAALADPAVRKVLDAMHGSPEARWTVESLADAAGLSRSAFAERFHDVVGEPPMEYLTNWRMQVARSLLAHSQRSVADIARTAGYGSVDGFRRRFKAGAGVSPTQFRKAAR